MNDNLPRLIKKYKKVLGYEPNINNPQTLSEKLLWIRINGNLERFANYTDKYAVRQFIKKRIGKQYLVPLYGVYNHVDQINFRSLPRSFVLKATHGCGWNILVKDKFKLDWLNAKKQMNEWMNTNYFNKTGERHYKPLKGRAIIEKYLQDPTGDLKDYKFHCFHGKPMVVRVMGDRFGTLKDQVYDMEWKELPFESLERNPYSAPLERPIRFTEMVDVAQKLSRDFAYVRVDLYHTNNKVYFGELTFLPSGGVSKNPYEYQKWLGSHLDLSRY
ncbi:ATP-grasp fold amidoligase family protein [Alkalihalobacterium elongatum]|uniref:ATP-grasp fold amidoligase family protein n=1 Tax=Alkalihalobacterium elongatum TaxID=2675466 RepID=UPI001C1FD27C|nr:ATP-grasp fold amidoligase family protein [Alkalihalobacterium elongatum]